MNTENKKEELGKGHLRVVIQGKGSTNMEDRTKTSTEMSMVRVNVTVC